MIICPFLRDNLLRNRDSSSARTVSPRSNKDTERARDPERIVASLQVQTQQPIKSASYSHTCFSREAMPLLLAFSSSLHYHYCRQIVRYVRVECAPVLYSLRCRHSSFFKRQAILCFAYTPPFSSSRRFFFQANAPDSTRFV